MPRGGVIANFVGVDVALLSYFFFWYLGNYYCPRPRPNLRVSSSTPPPRRQTLTRFPRARRQHHEQARPQELGRRPGLPHDDRLAPARRRRRLRACSPGRRRTCAAPRRSLSTMVSVCVEINGARGLLRHDGPDNMRDPCLR